MTYIKLRNTDMKFRHEFLRESKLYVHQSDLVGRGRFVAHVQRTCDHSRIVIVDLLLLLLMSLEGLEAQLGLVLACYVSAHRVVSGEGAGTEWTRDSNALMPLADVSPQVCLVAVQSLAERTLQFLSWNNAGSTLKILFYDVRN